MEGEITGKGAEMERKLYEKGYEMLDSAGQGAFSRVYRVRKRDTGEFFACKVSGKKEMLAAEAKLLGQVSHPLFPRFCDHWQEQERAFLIMEYLPGMSLKHLVEKRGGLSPAQTARIGMSLAQGLLYLHERCKPVLYRDLNPGNVQILQDGRAKLLDLGCACALGENRDRAGTPGFAPPEQLTGESLSAAGDIYAFGKMLEYMLQSGSLSGKKSGRCGERKCRKTLEALLAECTRRDPEKRPGDMRFCLDMLWECLEEEKRGRLLWGWKEKTGYRAAKAVWKKS